MLAAAEALEFERAAALRDRIQQMRQQMGKRIDEAEIEHATRQSSRQSPQQGIKPLRPDSQAGEVAQDITVPTEFGDPSRAGVHSRFCLGINGRGGASRPTNRRGAA